MLRVRAAPVRGNKMVPGHLATMLVPCFTASSVAPWRSPPFSSPPSLSLLPPPVPPLAPRRHGRARGSHAGLPGDRPRVMLTQMRWRRWRQVCASVWRAPALCGSSSAAASVPRRPRDMHGSPRDGHEKGARRPGAAAGSRRTCPARV
jgi:hypothetical protein